MKTIIILICESSDTKAICRCCNLTEKNEKNKKNENKIKEKPEQNVHANIYGRDKEFVCFFFGNFCVHSSIPWISDERWKVTVSFAIVMNSRCA